MLSLAWDGKYDEVKTTLNFLALGAEKGLGSTSWLDEYIEKEAKDLEERYAPLSMEEEEQIHESIEGMVDEMFKDLPTLDEDSDEEDSKEEDDA